MKRLFPVIVFLFFSIDVYASNDSLLNSLTETIARTDEYDKSKIRQINELKSKLGSMEASGISEAFDINEEIYEEYKSYNYDSASKYAIKLLQIGYASKNEELLNSAKLKMSFVLLSAGFYKETLDSLKRIDVQQINNGLKAEYYLLYGRYYYDLADYIYDNNYSVKYDIIGCTYIDSALQYLPDGSFDHYYYTGLKFLKQSKYPEALHFLEQSLHLKGGLTQHQLALATSTLSGIYLRNGNTEKGIELLIRASEADIRSSTKETFAPFYLSTLLYKTGDIKHAAIFIENAITNAEFYGARQRKLQASSILPIIEGERIDAIEKQKSILIRYAIVVTLLVISLLILAYIVRAQLKKLKLSQKALHEAHELQQYINEQLKRNNAQLEHVNMQLAESSKIKEEYIGYFFNADSEFYGRISKIKQTIEQKLQDKKYEEIRFFLNKIDAKKEKEELISNFDRLFLRLFPDFVEKVNALLRPHEIIKLKDNELLNNDLRIFALIRMGIADTEKIASILDYSVKTIYTYKSKIKSKSDIPNDEFEDKIMQIKAH